LSSRICIKSHLLSFDNRVKINCDHRTRSILTDAIYQKHMEYKMNSTIALARSAMERIPLHSWEMEFSIQYHMTITANIKRSEFNKVLYNIVYSIV
jgi:hypothetical protein